MGVVLTGRKAASSVMPLALIGYIERERGEKVNKRERETHNGNFTTMKVVESVIAAFKGSLEMRFLP